MPLDITPEKLCASISELLRADVVHDDSAYRLALRKTDVPVIAEISHTKFSGLVARLEPGAKVIGDTSFGTSHLYEGLTSEETRFGVPMLLRGSKAIEMHDAENDLTYRLGPPSDEFLVFFLSRLADLAPAATIRSTASNFRLRHALENVQGVADALELVRAAYPRLLSCRVESKSATTPDALADRANAFLFQLTYNLNVALVETRSLDEFVRTGRIASMRRSRTDEIEAPKRLYIRDLTYHYQLGVSAESPVLEFLSFYHVAEHFFEGVFQDDLIEAIRDRVTRPDFSAKRKRDVQSLIREIYKRQRVRDDAIIFSEQEALRLTLVKYVPLDNVRTKLAQYDKTLEPYFKAHAVAFCAAKAVDLSHEDDKVVFDGLAKRIYRTRNAIVHSKDGEQSRYMPFEHDDILAKEVPLIRFIAEEIIIATSKQA